jgi:hypothetical protein
MPAPQLEDESMTDDPMTFDVRILERKLRRGLISRKDYEKYLKSLPDRSDNTTRHRTENRPPPPPEPPSEDTELEEDEE